MIAANWVGREAGGFDSDDNALQVYWCRKAEKRKGMSGYLVHNEPSAADLEKEGAKPDSWVAIHHWCGVYHKKAYRWSKCSDCWA